MNGKNVMISLQSGYHEGKDIILDRPYWVCVYIYIGFVCLCHVTNASFKHWVGILLMPKIDRAHKNYHTPEIWKETHIRKIFYGTLILRQSSMICIDSHVGGHTLSNGLLRDIFVRPPTACWGYWISLGKNLFLRVMFAFILKVELEIPVVNKRS